MATSPISSGFRNFEDYKRVRHLIRIPFHPESALREASVLKAQVLECQIQLIKKKIDLKALPQIFSEELKQIKERELKYYDQVLKEQPFTEEKRKEFKTHYLRILDQTLPKSTMRFDLHLCEESLRETKEYMDDLDLELSRCGTKDEQAEFQKYEQTEQKKEPPSNLWLACANGDVDRVGEELEQLSFWQSKSSFFNRTNSDGFAPLHLAAKGGRWAVVQLLLKNGADPKIQEAKPADDLKGEFQDQAIHSACRGGFLNIVEELLKKVTIDEKGDFGRTPLHVAVYNRQIEIVRFLLKQGANVNAQTSGRNGKITPLFEAIARDCEEIVRVLLAHPKIDVNMRGLSNETALCFAVKAENLTIIKLLVENPKRTKCTNPKDPNHLSQLLKNNPRMKDDIRKYLTEKLG